MMASAAACATVLTSQREASESAAHLAYPTGQILLLVRCVLVILTGIIFSVSWAYAGFIPAVFSQHCRRLLPKPRMRQLKKLGNTAQLPAMTSITGHHSGVISAAKRELRKLIA